MSYNPPCNAFQMDIEPLPCRFFQASLEDVNCQSKPKTILIYVGSSLTSVEMIFYSALSFIFLWEDLLQIK